MINNPPFKRAISDQKIKQKSETGGLIDLQYDNWTPELSDQQLFDIFDKGSSLNIFLRPSNEIKHRVGTQTYIENYALPNFQRKEDRYLCFTDGKHLEENKAFYSFKGILNYYCYSNCGPGFFNYGVVFKEESIDVGLSFMNKVRYEEMEWIVRDDYELIFDGIEFHNNIEIIKAIQHAKNFRISITLANDVELRQDVDLLFYRPESETIWGYSKSAYLPASMGNPKDFHEFCEEHFLKDSEYYDPELYLKLDDHGYPTFVQFFADGTYTDAYMSLNNTKDNYKNIKIFASRN